MRLWGILCIALLLSSCSYRIDEIRIFVGEDRSGTMVGNGHKELSGREDREQLNNRLARIREELEACGLDVIQSQNSRRATIEVSTDFASPDILRSKVRCSMDEWREVDFAVEQDKGLIYDTFRTQVTLERSTFDAETAYQEFPRELYFTVPGEISSHTIGSDLLAGVIEVDEPANDQISVTIGRGSDYEDLRNELQRKLENQMSPRCDDEGLDDQSKAELEQECRQMMDDYHLEKLNISIESTVARYSLQELIAILGVIFGSGLLLELARRVFLVRLVPESGEEEGA